MASLIVSVHAEVYDKIPTQSQIALYGLIGAVACFLAGRHKPWTLLLTVLIPAGFFYFLLDDFRSTDLGPDILNEMGRTYVTSGYVFAALIPVSVCLGLFFRKLDRKIQLK